MNEPRECTAITARFFQALDMIKAQKRIRGMKTFTDLYNENYWNFCTVRKENKRIKQEWLTYLVRDFDVSPTWLLTGIGGMFTRDIVPLPTHRYTKKQQQDNDTDKT